MKNGIKTIIFILIAATMLLPVSLAQAAEATPQITVTLMNQDPDPVGPGKYVDLRFKVENDGTITAKDVYARIEPKYPFSLDPGTNATIYLGDIPGYGNSKSVIVVKYKVRVAEDAVTGANDISFGYNIDSKDWISQDYTINIRSIDATISIESVTTSPKRIVPGNPASVLIRLKNMDDTDLKDISLKLDLSLSTLSSAATAEANLNQLPFAPLDSATEKKIRLLGPGEDTVFSYDIIAFADAAPGVYKVPIELRYYDYLGNEYVKDDIISLISGAPPNLLVTIDSTDLSLNKPDGNVVIKFVNSGLTQIQFLNVRLPDTKDYKVISPQDVYIGNIASDDYETAQYQLHIMNITSIGSGEGRIVLPVAVSFSDGNNVGYNKTYQLDLDLYSPSLTGTGKSSNASLYIIILIVVGIVVFFYLRSRRRAKKTRK